MNTVQAPKTESATIGHPEPDSRHKVVQLRGTRLAREKKRTMELMASLPEGIRIGQWKDSRPSPYYVRYGSPRKVESFVTELDRNDHAEKLAAAKEVSGSTVLNYSAADWHEFQEWKKNHKRTSLLTKDAVPKYIALRVLEGVKEGSDTHSHIKTHLRRFVEKFGHLPLNLIPKDDLRTWLFSLKTPRTGQEPMSKATIKNHRKDVNLFFERAVLEDWTEKNPMTAVKSPKLDEVPKEPMPPHDLFRLLKANKDLPVVGRLALELFGGLRCSSAERLHEKHIRWEAKGIAMPGQGHKSESWKYRQGHPPVLWAWLKHAPKACWTDVSPKNYDHLKHDAFVRAGVDNPGNVLRDSFASYWLAITKSYEVVGYLMQHTRRGTTMLYEGVADESDARLVMAMTPAAVRGTWEDFLAANKPQSSSP